MRIYYLISLVNLARFLVQLVILLSFLQSASQNTLMIAKVKQNDNIHTDLFLGISLK